MVRRGNLILILLGMAILGASAFSTKAAVRWLSERTTIVEELRFVRGVRPDFAYAETVSEIMAEAGSGRLTRIELTITPAAHDDDDVAAAEKALAAQRLDAALAALREAGLDEADIPLLTQMAEPVRGAEPAVQVFLERMAAR